MVSLIVLLITIALGGIVAIATAYNGGDAFRNGSANAYATQLTNAGQQISAANILYANDNGGTYSTSVATLTTGGEYLASAPRVPKNASLSDDITGNVITVTGLTDEVCEAVNKQAGEADPTAVADTSTMAFGCVNSTQEFTYR